MIKNQTILLNQVVTKGKGNIVSNMGGEIVMLNVERGKYYNLNEIGAKIWDILDEKISIQQLISKLVTEFDVEKTECELQVLSFLELLQKEGLIKIADLEVSKLTRGLEVGS